MIVHGYDVSLNHGAIIQLRDGELDHFWFWTKTAGVAKKHHFGYRIKIPNIRDKPFVSAFRINWIKELVERVVVHSRPDFAGIEDYAIRAEQGAHFLGEAGGVTREVFFEHGVKFRTHDPPGVKMFAAWDGTADKDEVRFQVEERWGVNFDRFEVGKDTATSEDLCDAFVIAQMVHAEAMLRSGEWSLTDLEHDKERQVFNRTTKTHPINILGREWIYDPDWKKKLKKQAKQTIHYLQGKS